MKRLKRLLSGLLLWCMVVTMISIPATTANAMPPKSGECGVHGDNVIWILDDTDTLIISGTGAMKEYSDITDIPWTAYKTSIKAVRIEVGVTSIAQAAFSLCSNLSSVTIPNSITRIGDAAFVGCSLRNLTIPDSVTQIGKSAFASCSDLTSLTIPDSVTSIEEALCFKCSSLTSVTIPEGVTRVEDNAFELCNSLRDVYYNGTKDQWKTIFIGNNNISLNNATIHCNRIQSGTEDAMWQGHRYQVFNNLVSTWTEAETYCESLGGHLATICCQEENDYVYQVMVKAGYTSAYLGLTDRDNEGTWIWVTGEPVTYTNWHSGEPNSENSNEDYAMFYYKYTDGTWNDGDFGHKVGSSGSAFICEWDGVNTEDLAGFSAERDGWCLTNTNLTFGYDNKYHIPAKRYYEVFGISLSSLLQSIGSITEWNGSCFGLSLLSIANYNGQIDLSQFFSSQEEGLYNYGFSHIASQNDGKQYFSVSRNSEIVETIEKAQLSQYSMEFKKSEVFKGDPHYSKLLNYLNGDNPKPLLVTLNAAHAVVIDTTQKPIELEDSPGWYAVVLYDSNAPAPSDKLAKPEWWYEQKSSLLLLNTNNGEWQYWQNGECRDYMTYYCIWKVQNIQFYDVSMLDDSFFYKPLSLWGNLITIDFSSSNFSIKDQNGQVLFQVKDNTVVSMAETCKYSPSYNGTSEILHGTVSVPIQLFEIEANQANITMLSDEILLALSSANNFDATININSRFIDISSNEMAEVTVVIQDGISVDSYSAIKVNTTLNSSDITIDASNQGGAQITSSTQDAFVDIQMESSNHDEIETYSKIPAADITYLDIDAGKLYLQGNTYTSPDLPFNDISKRSYYYDAVVWAVEQGITSGTSPSTFSPNDSCTRAQMVTFLWRATGSPAPVNNYNPFSDVTAGTYYYDAVLWAVEQGITTGTSATTFNPNAIVTRGQTVTFLYRTAGSPATNSSIPFTDTDSRTYYYNAVLWAVAHGITTGTTTTTFSPNNNCTRSQIVTFLYRAR